MGDPLFPGRHSLVGFELTGVSPVVYYRQYTDHVCSSLVLLPLSVVGLEQEGSAFILCKYKKMWRRTGGHNDWKENWVGAWGGCSCLMSVT